MLTVASCDFINALLLDEAALYDRQIRLWGLEAQQRYSNHIHSVQWTQLKMISLEPITRRLSHLYIFFIIYPKYHQ